MRDRSLLPHSFHHMLSRARQLGTCKTRAAINALTRPISPPACGHGESSENHTVLLSPMPLQSVWRESKLMCNLFSPSVGQKRESRRIERGKRTEQQHGHPPKDAVITGSPGRRGRHFFFERGYRGGCPKEMVSHRCSFHTAVWCSAAQCCR